MTRNFKQILYGFRYSFVALSLIATILVVATTSASADSAPSRFGERLLAVHDDGMDRGVLTKATTIREAFKEAGIVIDSSDLIEPAIDEKLVASNYEVNIYRARPVTIIDGTVRTKVMSAYRTPEQIVTHAGLEFNDEDEATMNISHNSAAEGATILLEIKRATPFTLVLYGKPATVYSQASTVAEMLKSKNIKLGKDDTLSVAASSPLVSGMTIEIWRNGVQTVTLDEEIAFGVDKIQDVDRDSGYRLVKTPGVPGKRTVTYEIEMRDGVEVSRKEIQSVVITEPKQQVEVVGTKVSLPPGSHQDWMAAAGIAPSDFGYVNYIVSRENGSWHPCRVQGAGMIIDCQYPGTAMRGYGLVQATPGNKMDSAGSDWQTNPITQLRWANSYAVGRYGSWENAYNYWIRNSNW